MVNVKPSRFGGLRELCDAYDYCDERGIRAYGGGQFELGVGRGHIQYLASLFHPDTPNDVAPRATTSRRRRPGCPTPLDAERAATGFRGTRLKGRRWPSSFADKLNEQIAYEFAAAQQYVASPSTTTPNAAPARRLLLRQALEERNHAMMIVQYLLDPGAGGDIPGVEAPRTSFADIVEPVRWRSTRRSGSASRSTRLFELRARRATTWPSSSCSGSSRSRSRRSRSMGRTC